MTTTHISANHSPDAYPDRPIRGPAARHAAAPEAAIADTTRRTHQAAWREVAPWRFELFLAFCSGWVATQLWIWPSQFPLGDTPMSISAGLRGHERSWAIVCAVAALLKLCGLAGRLWTPWTATAAMLMVCGLFMSIVLWTVVGVSWSFDFPHSMAPLMLIGGALGAAWQLAQWKPPGRSHK